MIVAIHATIWHILLLSAVCFGGGGCAKPEWQLFRPEMWDGGMTGFAQLTKPASQRAVLDKKQIQT